MLRCMLIHDGVDSLVSRFRGMPSPTRQNPHPSKKSKTVAGDLERQHGPLIPVAEAHAEAHAASFRSPAELTLSQHQTVTPDQTNFPRSQ